MATFRRRAAVHELKYRAGLCDRLEASLATGDATRRCLLDALLQEALTPVEKEAA